MKKLLLATTSAAVLIGMSGAASAQSVLERVLSQTQSLNDVTGIFANTAENIGGAGTTTVFDDGEGNIITQAEFEAELAQVLDRERNSFTITPTGTTNTAGQALFTVTDADGAAVEGLEEDVTLGVAETFVDNRVADARDTFVEGFEATTLLTDAAGSIDGSINIIARRLDEATANVTDDIRALEAVTTNFGNMSTTVLGAVNTGEIGLGTNQVVEEALAGTSQAIRSTIEQIGTIEDRTQIAVNSALNTMNIDGSISIELDGVNASVAAISPDQLSILSADGSLALEGLGDLLGSMDTTVLGAVNTGTIVSGVGSQVDGAVAGIIGTSATNMFAD